MKFHCVTFCLLLGSKQTLQRSNNDSPTYMAAVVEYSPIVDSDNMESEGRLNTENYLKIIDKAASYVGAKVEIDIIVFPESGLAVPSKKHPMATRSRLASYIPDPADKVIPCDDKSNHYEFTLRNISCAARNHKIYNDVPSHYEMNHREKVDCTGKDCGDDGYLIYNTNVVFDRDGQVIARYRKYNLFDEFEVNRTTPIATTFTTDFGVTFGTFICFDLVFAVPSLNLTHLLGVTDIAYSTHWYDISPYFFATEMQAAFAYTNDVNLLASGYSFPRTDSGGSGIFLGKQGYVEVVSENKRTNVLLVSEIPKVINGKRTRNLDRSKVHVYEFTKGEISTTQTASQVDSYISQPFLPFYPSELIDTTYRNFKKTVCDRDLCCDFVATIEYDPSNITDDSNYYRYRFGAANNTFILPFFDWSGAKSCAILVCTSDKRISCGKTFPDSKTIVTPITFTSLKITTRKIANVDAFAFPLAYSQKFYPINATDFTFTTSNFGNASTYHIELKKPRNDILAFSILVRTSKMDRVINSMSMT